jgi:hypothetical protein
MKWDQNDYDYEQQSDIAYIRLVTPDKSENNYYKSSEQLNKKQLEQKYFAERQSEAKRKIVYNASLNLIVKIPDSTTSQLMSIAKRYNGYSQTAGTYYVVIRVQSQYLNQAIADIEKLGKTERKSVSGKDVTDEYLDLNIRLENATKARKRYLELLEKSQSVEEALKVEKELERLNTEIDLLKGKMNKLDHLSTYSTISVRIKEKVKPGVLGYIGIGLWSGVKWLFVRN